MAFVKFRGPTTTPTLPASTTANNAPLTNDDVDGNFRSINDSLESAVTSLASKANLASPTFTGTVGGITRAMVGLGNADNTADVNKSVNSAGNITGGTGGQLLYQSSAGVTARLPNGTAGQYLQSAGGVAAPEWNNVTIPVAPIVNDAALTVPAPVAGVSNTAFGIALSGSFSANSSINRSINTTVGPALTALASTMAGGTVGYMRKTAADTYSISLNGSDLTSLTAANINGQLSIGQGGTGASSTSQALTNLLPAGATSGFVLTTSGPGSFFWSAPTGGAGDSQGTTITTSRVSYTATASQTSFTGVGTYIIGAGQLRVFINGVRQMPSAYTETTSTSFTLLTGLDVGDLVLAEVDANNSYVQLASATAYSPTGGVASTTVQNAISELDSEKMNISGGTFTGAVTLVAGTTGVAPLRLTAGSLLSTPLVGAIEFNGNNVFATISGGTRRTLAVLESPAFSGTATFVALTAVSLTVGTGETGSSITMVDTDEGNRIIHCNSNRIGFLNQAANWGSYCEDDGSWVSVGNVTAFSDERLKKNWRDLDSSIVDKLADVKSGIFDRVDNDLTQIGVSAQSLNKIIPEAVHTGSDGLMSVAYGNAALALCVEMAKEIRALKQRIDILENK